MASPASCLLILVLIQGCWGQTTDMSSSNDTMTISEMNMTSQANGDTTMSMMTDPANDTSMENSTSMSEMSMSSMKTDSMITTTILNIETETSTSTTTMGEMTTMEEMTTMGEMTTMEEMTTMGEMTTMKKMTTMETKTTTTTTAASSTMKMTNPSTTVGCPVCTGQAQLGSTAEPSKFGTDGLMAFAITLAIALLLLIALIIVIVRRRMKKSTSVTINGPRMDRPMDGVAMSMPMNNIMSGDFGPNVETIDLEDEVAPPSVPKVGNGAGLSSFGGGRSQEASAEDIDNLPKPSWLTVEPSNNTGASTESLHSSDRMINNTSGDMDKTGSDENDPEEPSIEEPMLSPPPDTDSDQDSDEEKGL